MPSTESTKITIERAANLRNAIDALIPRPPAPGQPAPAAPFKLRFKAMRRLCTNRNLLDVFVKPAEEIIQNAVLEAREGLKEGESIPNDKIRELNTKQQELFRDEVEVNLEPIDEKDFESVDDPRIMPLLVADDGLMIREKNGS